MSKETWQISAEEQRCLEALLDELIPASADGTRPAAGALGLAPEIVASRTDQAAREQLRDGLERVRLAARELGAQDLVTLSREQRVEVITCVAEAAPEFLGAMLHDTYVAYYQNERVARALGMESWPPHPNGFPLEPGDLSLLDPVRARGPRYREV